MDLPAAKRVLHRWRSKVRQDRESRIEELTQEPLHLTSAKQIKTKNQPFDLLLQENFVAWKLIFIGIRFIYIRAELMLAHPALFGLKYKRVVNICNLHLLIERMVSYSQMTRKGREDVKGIIPPIYESFFYSIYIWTFNKWIILTIINLPPAEHTT